MKNESCIEEEVAVDKWPELFAWWWWRGQHIWDLASCRAGASWCPVLTARPSDQVGMMELRIFEGLLSSSVCALPAGADGELHPRPSRSPGTSSRRTEHRTVPQTRGTGAAGNQVRTGREWVQWKAVGGSSGRTRLSLGTGSRSSGGHGRRFVGSVQLPGSSFLSARSTEDGILMRDLRSLLGERRKPSKPSIWTAVPGPRQYSQGFHNIWRQNWAWVRRFPWL